VLRCLDLGHLHGLSPYFYLSGGGVLIKSICCMVLVILIEVILTFGEENVKRKMASDALFVKLRVKKSNHRFGWVCCSYAEYCMVSLGIVY